MSSAAPGTFLSRLWQRVRVDHPRRGWQIISVFEPIGHERSGFLQSLLGNEIRPGPPEAALSRRSEITPPPADRWRSRSGQIAAV